MHREAFLLHITEYAHVQKCANHLPNLFSNSRNDNLSHQTANGCSPFSLQILKIIYIFTCSYS